MDEKDGQLLNYKVVAKGVHPQQSNLVVDFVEEASKEEKSIKKVKKKIDDYLSAHSLNKFDPGTEKFQNNY